MRRIFSRSDLQKWKEKWRKIADDAERATRNLLEKNDIPPNKIYNPIHEMAEISLKGYLAEHNILFYCDHDIANLLDYCYQNLPGNTHEFLKLKKAASLYLKYYAETTYPEIYIELSRIQVIMAFIFAKKIKELVIRYTTN